MLEIVDKLLEKIFLVCLVCLIFIGSYPILCKNWDYQFALPQKIKKYEPDLSFDELQRINPDVVGWLQIDSTNINYPLLQAKDNVHYLNKDVMNNYSLAGSLFIDYRNCLNFEQLNTIIYGHYMDQGLMFSDLINYKEPSYYKQHSTGKIYLHQTWYSIQFISFMEVNAQDAIIYNPYMQNENEFIFYLKQNSLYDMNYELEEGQKYITLSTCNPDKTNSRYVLIGFIRNGNNKS